MRLRSIQVVLQDARTTRERTFYTSQSRSNPPSRLYTINPKKKYPQYFPSWTPDHKYPQLEPFDHYDHAKDADPTLHNLKSSACIKKLTPATGSAITGIQLSSLTPQAKDEIALLVAKRKVVVFRSQDFKDLPTASVVDFCKYFGPLLIFPLGPYLPDHPEIHIAHNGGGDNRFRDLYASRTTSVAWHIDNSANPQPSGLVFLYMLECPDAGGDTIFVNTAEAYNKLSQPVAERLHGLNAEHDANTGITSVHPVVRTHDVTGEKCLFVNPLCTLFLQPRSPSQDSYLHRTYPPQIRNASSASRKKKATPCSNFSSTISPTRKTVKSAFNGPTTPLSFSM